MCVYQSYVYIFVRTYAMQVMGELNRFSAETFMH